MKTQPTINVALVDGDDRLQHLLESAGARVSRLSSEQLIALAGALVPPPVAIIVDTRQRPLQPAALAAARRNHPGAARLMVAPRLDPALLLAAMREGITEAIAEPIVEAELAAALQRAVEQSPDAAGKVLAFVGVKGGVGATTLAVNVAIALHGLSSKDVLLIDMHLTNGDACLALGAEPRFSVLDALRNTHRLDQTLLSSLVTRVGGVDLLASSQGVTSPSIAASQIHALLAIAASRYPYTVLDVHRCDGLMLANLDLATTIVVVTDQMLANVRSASRLTAALREQYGKERVQVVLSRADARAALGRGDVEKAVGQPILFVVPSHYRSAAAALDAGEPLAGDRRSDLGRAYHALAAALADLETPPRAVAGRLRRARQTA